MWDEAKQRRLEELRLAESERRLTDAERAELAALISVRCVAEERTLQRATRRTAENVARLEQQVHEVEEQNRELAALIREQEAYISHVQAIISEQRCRPEEVTKT